MSCLFLQCLIHIASVQSPSEPRHDIQRGPNHTHFLIWFLSAARLAISIHNNRFFIIIVLIAQKPKSNAMASVGVILMENVTARGPSNFICVLRILTVFLLVRIGVVVQE